VGAGAAGGTFAVLARLLVVAEDDALGASSADRACSATVCFDRNPSAVMISEAVDADFDAVDDDAIDDDDDDVEAIDPIDVEGGCMASG
jgi:hypothetical protein